MKLSVSCPSCGKNFHNIKPEMAGKKARCRCGTVVRLGSLESPQPKPTYQPPNREPIDLLDIDLLGDEMLGDQLLGDELIKPDHPAPEPTGTTEGRQKPTRQNPKPDKSSSANAQRTKSKPARIRRGPTENVPPEVDLDPPGQESKPKPRTESITNSPSKSKSWDAPAPEVSITVSPSKSESNPKSQRPFFDQTYGDLDEILAGAGDASPLMVRPTPADSDESDLNSQNGRASISHPSPKHKSLTLGFLAALCSATLAIWFGLFVASSRFQIVDWFLVSGFSTHLYSVFNVTFGESEVPFMFQIMFAILGWLVWGVAIAMVLTGVGQFVNAFAKLLTGRQLLSWSDGLVGMLGVSAVFMLVAIVVCQASFASQEHLALDAYERPFVAEGERLENVARLRAVIDERNRSFSISMLAGATVPLSIFFLSIVRLFTKSSDGPSSQPKPGSEFA